MKSSGLLSAFKGRVGRQDLVLRDHGFHFSGNAYATAPSNVAPRPPSGPSPQTVTRDPGRFTVSAWINRSNDREGKAEKS